MEERATSGCPVCLQSPLVEPASVKQCGHQFWYVEGFMSFVMLFPVTHVGLHCTALQGLATWAHCHCTNALALVPSPSEEAGLQCWKPSKLLPCSLECLRKWCSSRRNPRCPLCQADVTVLRLEDGSEEVRKRAHCAAAACRGRAVAGAGSCVSAAVFRSRAGDGAKLLTSRQAASSRGGIPGSTAIRWACIG